MRCFFGIGAWLSLMCAAPVQAAANAQSVLAASDAIRNPEKSFGLTATLVEYKAGKQTDSNTLAIYSRADAANGDVVTVNLAKDYRAELAGEEEVADGDRQSKRCYKLALAASSPDVTYHNLEMWVEQATSRPVKARFYTESGRLLKTVYYRRYQKQLGVERPTETIIIDGLDPQWVTVMRYTDYAWRDVPESWLQRDYLPRFQPE